MGRPTKLDDTILLPDGKGGSVPRTRWEVIVERVRAGSYPEVAAMSTGVSSTTFYRWRTEGEDRVVDGKVRRARPMYREFREALDRASAEAEMVAVAHIQKAASEDWRAAMAYLERRAPARWRRRDTTYHAGPAEGDGPLVLDLTGKVNLGDETLRKLDDVLEILDESGALDRTRREAEDPPVDPGARPGPA